MLNAFKSKTTYQNKFAFATVVFLCNILRISYKLYWELICLIQISTYLVLK